MSFDEGDFFRKIIKKFMRDLEEFEKQFFNEELSGKEEFFYGYSVTIGPDGKPVIREFGNIPGRKHMIREENSERKPKIVEVPEETLEDVDVFEYDDEVEVVAEIGNVRKEEIEVRVLSDEETLIIRAPGYYRKVKLPAKVNPKVSKAHYRNGVLEIMLKKKNASKTIVNERFQNV